MSTPRDPTGLPGFFKFVRMKSRKKKFTWWITMFVIICCLVAYMFVFRLPTSPEPSLSAAREAISTARKVISPDFSPLSMKEAQILYDSAMKLWERENQRFIFSRNYDSVVIMAGQSEKLALSSPEMAKQETRVFVQSLEKDLSLIKKDTEFLKPLLNRLPITLQTGERYSTAKLMITEAQQALNKDQYRESRLKTDQAGQILHAIMQETQKLLTDYFSDFNEWKLMSNEAIRNSRSTKKPLILVDKFAGKCHLYQNGALITTFQAEFGKNWIGHKRYAGDKKTPEGIYRVTRKKEKAQTKYHKALLLDYPNNDDQKQFKEDLRNRVIPATAHIGGLIEIHGGGGRGVNWTDGCVALTNEDMDQLYRQVPNGSQVVIIGSLEPLSNYLNN